MLVNVSMYVNIPKSSLRATPLQYGQPLRKRRELHFFISEASRLYVAMAALLASHLNLTAIALVGANFDICR